MVGRGYWCVRALIISDNGQGRTSFKGGCLWGTKKKRQIGRKSLFAKMQDGMEQMVYACVLGGASGQVMTALTCLASLTLGFSFFFSVGARIEENDHGQIDEKN